MFYESSQKQWLFITDVFSKVECDQISAYSEMLESEKNVITGKESTRSSTIAWMPLNAESQWIYQRLEHTIELTNPNTFHFDGLNIGESIQISTYAENDFYDWHIDIVKFPSSPPVRKVSCSVLLNDFIEFDGGKLQIKAWNEETIKLKQGQGVFFVSFFQHNVLPVTAGIRKSLTAWFNGPAFK